MSLRWDYSTPATTWTNIANSDGIIVLWDCRFAREAIKEGKMGLSQEINSLLFFLQWIPAHVDMEGNEMAPIPLPMKPEHLNLERKLLRGIEVSKKAGKVSMPTNALDVRRLPAPLKTSERFLRLCQHIVSRMLNEQQSPDEVRSASQVE
ncbi:RNase H domain-containing protein [Trichonephila clavipes]|nr:RNase H domain-containing protein [Trichonephila clavipes]